VAGLATMRKRRLSALWPPTVPSMPMHRLASAALRPLLGFVRSGCRSAVDLAEPGSCSATRHKCRHDC
jgi:hypothetical protein